MKRLFILIAILSIITLYLSGCSTDSYNSLEELDDSPKLIKVIPKDGSSDVLPDETITLLFSMPMKTVRTLSDIHLYILNSTSSNKVSIRYSSIWKDNKTLEIIPEYPGLFANRSYEIFVDQKMESTFNRTLKKSYSSAFTTSSNTDDFPHVEMYAPTEGEPSPSCVDIYLSFNKPMNIISVENALRLIDLTDSSSITTAVSWFDAKNLKAKILSSLIDKHQYKIELLAGIKDIYNNPMLEDFQKQFTVDTNLDDIKPELIASIPSDGSATHSASEWIKLYFNRQVDFDKLKETILLDGENINTDNYESMWHASNSFWFRKKMPLSATSPHEVTISVPPVDLCGNAGSVFSFTFSVLKDMSYPSITAVVPVTGADSVSIYSPIDIYFDEPMEQSLTKWQNNLTIENNEGELPINGTFSWDASDHLIYQSQTPFEIATEYTITIGTEAYDTSGNKLQNPYQVTFLTETESMLQPPSVPTEFTASSINDDNCTLEWNSVDNTEGYLLYQNDECSTTNLTPIGIVVGTNAYISNLSPETEYAFYIKAYNLAGHSDYSSCLLFSTTPLQIPPDTVPTLEITGSSYTWVELTWSEDTDAEHYNILSGTECSLVTTIGTSLTNTFTYNNIVKNVSSCFRVQAVNSFGSGPVSNCKCYLVEHTPPLNPPVLSSTSVASNSVLLYWDAVSDTDNYKVWQRINTTYSSFTNVGETTGTSYFADNLLSNQSYSFFVRPENVYGSGADSNTITITTASVLPDKPILTHTMVTSSSVDLLWQNVNNAQTLVLLSGTDCSAMSVESTLSGTATSFSLTGLTHSVNYAFKLYGTNSSGDGDASECYEVMTDGIPPVGTLSVTTSFLSSTSAELSWTGTYSGIENYGIKRQGYVNFEGTISGTESSFILNNLVSCADYTFDIIPINSWGEGNPISVTFTQIGNPLPPELILADGTASAFTITWTDNNAFSCRPTTDFVVNDITNIDGTSIIVTQTVPLSATNSITFTSSDIELHNYQIYATNLCGENISSPLYTSHSFNMPQYMSYTAASTILDIDAVINSSSGNFNVVYTGIDSGRDVYFIRFNSTGTAIGSSTKVNTTLANSQELPSIDMNSSEDYVIAWMSYNQISSTSGYDIFARRYNSSGTPLSSEIQVNTTTDEMQDHPSIAMDNSGNFTVTWETDWWNGTSSNVQTIAQRFNSSGAKLDSEFKVNTSTTNHHERPDIVMNSTSGDFIISWFGDGNGDTMGIFAQRYLSTGIPIGTEVGVNTYTSNYQVYQDSAINSSGDFIIAWQSEGQDGYGQGIYAQMFDSSGNTIGSEFRVNTNTSVDQTRPSVAMDDSGNFVVTWLSNHLPNGKTGLMLQKFNSSRNHTGPELFITDNLSTNQSGKVIMNTSNFVVLWACNNNYFKYTFFSY